MRPSRTPSKSRRAVTLLELLVVVVILGILSTVATNVYTGHVLRAKNAATRDTIREIGVAVVRYEIDTGEFPLSGSGVVVPTAGGANITSRLAPRGPSPTAEIAALGPDTPALNEAAPRSGSGFLYLQLVHSLSADIRAPFPITWDGPYLEFPADKILGVDDTGLILEPGQVQILDSFGIPFEYVNYLEYITPLTQVHGVTIAAAADPNTKGSELFATGQKPLSAQDSLPDGSPFQATETFYNPRTFQIYSVGVNGTTYDGLAPPTDDPGLEFAGAERDDINNFGY